MKRYDVLTNVLVIKSTSHTHIVIDFMENLLDCIYIQFLEMLMNKIEAQTRYVRLSNKSAKLLISYSVDHFK